MLIVETGSGIPGANSYADAATVTTYCAAHGHAAWAGTDAVKEAAILRAMDYIETLSWAGVKTSDTNPLRWPRAWVNDRDGYALAADAIPGQVVQALCEAALRELVTPGGLLPDATKDEGLSSLEVPNAVKMTWKDSARGRSESRLIRALLYGLIGAAGGVEMGRG